MGLTINYPDNSTKYAAISGNPIYIAKQGIGLDENGDAIYNWKIDSDIQIWDSKESRDEGGDVNTRVSATAFSNTIPTNCYSCLYEEYKKTLHSYEDDI